MTNTVQGGKKNHPLSVYLTDDDRQVIDEIAAWSGQSRHAVLQYAVKRVINDWRKGKKPELQIQHKLKP